MILKNKENFGENRKFVEIEGLFYTNEKRLCVLN